MDYLSDTDCFNKAELFSLYPEEIISSPDDILNIFISHNSDFSKYQHIVDEIYNFTHNLSNIKAGIVAIHPDDVVITRNSIEIRKLTLNTGAIIANRFRNADTVGVFVATIGSELETKSAELLRNGDYTEGFFFDLVASEMVEKCGDILEEKLITFLSGTDLKITNRYSPGYCQWNVSEQKKLFSFLPDGFAGITLTESSLMLPIKSISGLIGIGRNAKKEVYQCSICDFDKCFRKKV